MVMILMDLVGKNNGILFDFVLSGDVFNWVVFNLVFELISVVLILVVKVLGVIWGVGNNNVNCIIEVQVLVDNFMILFGVNGSNFGIDFKYGYIKELCVVYEINDVVYFCKQKDYSMFDFLGVLKNLKIII